MPEASSAMHYNQVFHACLLGFLCQTVYNFRSRGKLPVLIGYD
jgi:hypothetical protein